MTPNTSTPIWRATPNQLTTAIARAMNFNHRAVTATAYQPMASLPTAHTRPELHPFHLTINVGSW